MAAPATAGGPEDVKGLEKTRVMENAFNIRKNSLIISTLKKKPLAILK